MHPAPPDTGIVFRRAGSAVEIRANWANTIDSPLCTVLSNGEGNMVGTVEHLMAALAGAAIDRDDGERDLHHVEGRGAHASSTNPASAARSRSAWCWRTYKVRSATRRA